MIRIILILVILSITSVSAHNGENHLEKYRKNSMVIQLSSLKYDKLQGADSRLIALQKQIKLVNQNLFILRDMMAKDYPHVKESMSKYKIDYMGELESNAERLDSIVDKLREVQGTN